jgi:hypothetical protein
MNRIRQHLEFVAVFLLYWKAHRATYAFRIARGIAYRQIPF